MAPRETAGPSTAKARTDPWSTATSAWVQTIEKLTEQAGRAPSALRVPTDLFVQWVTFNERVVKTNLEYVLHLASRTRTAAKNAAHGAASTAAHTVDVATDFATSGFQAATDAVTTGVEVTADVQRDAAAERVEAERVGAERVEAEAAAREQARQEAAAQESAAREAAEQQAAQLQAAVADVDDPAATARGRYLGVKKANLAAELAHRGLPRTGTIPQLIDRLVADDAVNPARARRAIG